MIPKLHKRKTKKEKQIPTKVEKEKKVTQMHFVTVSSHNKSMRYQRVVRHRKKIVQKAKMLKEKRKTSTALRNSMLRKERFNK